MKGKQAGKFAVACMTAVTAFAFSGLAGAQETVHYPAGKSLFDAQCAVCHQAGGKGQDGLAPPLTEYPGKYATAETGRAQLVATLLHGMFGEIKVRDKHYNFKMPSFASASDDDIAHVLNYVVFDINAQHGDAKPFTAADIRAARAKAMDGTAVHAQREVVIKGWACDARVRAPCWRCRGPHAVCDVVVARQRVASAVVVADAGRSSRRFDHGTRACRRRGRRGARAAALGAQLHGLPHGDRRRHPRQVPPLANSLGYFTHLPAGREYVMRVPGASNSALSDGISPTCSTGYSPP